MNNQKIVVYVDDDIDDLETFQELYAQVDNAPLLKTFEWPDEALEYIKTGDFDKAKCFLLVDVNLRIIDGFDFVKEVRRLYPSDNLHITLITTSRNNREVIKAEEMWLQVIVKPSTIAGIQEIIDGIIEQCNAL